MPDELLVKILDFFVLLALLLVLDFQILDFGFEVVVFGLKSLDGLHLFLLLLFHLFGFFL